MSCFCLKEDSWKKLSDKTKCFILRKYFQKFIEISGLFAGFQSFVIVIDEIKDKYDIQLTLMMISYCSNISVCLTSLISYNLIIGGVYKSWLINVNLYCACMFFFSMLTYYTSFMILIYNHYQDDNYMYHVYAISCWTSVHGLFLIGYVLKGEQLKWKTDHKIREDMLLK